MILRSLFVTSCVASRVFAGEITVSPDRPLSVIVEEARKETKPVTVIMQAGTYPISEVIKLGASDSGIHFRNADGAEVVIDGGRRITGWKRQADGLWRTELPEVREGKWYFQ